MRKSKPQPTQNTRRMAREQLRAVLAADPMPPEVIAFAAPAVITAGAEASDGQPKRLPSVAMEAYNGGPMVVGGYYRPVVVDLSGVSGVGRPIPLLRDHDAGRIVGHGVATVKSGALSVAGTLSGGDQEVGEVARLAANGFPWQASIGLQPTKVEHVEAGATALVNGGVVTGPLVVVRAGRLKEVSIVAIGADGSTSTQVAAQGVGIMGFEAWLKANGFDAATLNDAQRVALQAAYQATLTASGGTGGQAGQSGQTAGQAGGGQSPINGNGQSTAAAALAAARARDERDREYGRIIASAIEQGMPTEQAELHYRHAVEAQMQPTQFELELLREMRNVDAAAPYGFARGPRGRQTETPAAVIECAFAQTVGQTEFERLEADGRRTTVELYTPEQQQRARDAFPRGLTLMELVAMAARRSGFNDNTYRISKAMLQAAFAPVNARGASTYDLSGILSNVANKSIVAGFDAVENTWREVSAIGTVTDFKEITHYALTGDFVYEKVGNGGELKNATMGEQSYGNKADTYGKIFSITRQDFINDDLSAFDRVRNLLGRGSALRLNLVFWIEFLADVTTFFTTGRGNYFEGAATNLQISSLTTAEQMFFDQTDPDGNPLGVSGAILLTPNATATTAVSLTRDTEIRDNTASKVYTTANPHAGKWRPVRSSYLNNANVPNGSATHWFLLADPMDLPVIETVFLNGQQRPTVEAAEADFDMLGVQMRGYHDFGCRKQEYRAGVRSKGAA